MASGVRSAQVVFFGIGIALVAGCGRIGFDLHPDDASIDVSADTHQDVVNDTNPDVPEDTCSNGQLDPGETGIDCGGPLCIACPAVLPILRLGLGSRHTCFLLASGAVRCWGDGSHGRTGHNSSADVGDDEPASDGGDVDVGAQVIALGVGGLHTCVLTDVGNVRCWGYNNKGQLGYGNTINIGDNEFPSTAGDVNVGGTVLQVAGGNEHTCALLSTGHVRCWGNGASGRLGYGNTNNIGDSVLPVTAGDVDVGGNVTQVVTGTTHSCALLDTGNVRCWGDGANGKLGYVDTSNVGDIAAPSSKGNVDVGGTVTQLAAGAAHTCALLNTGAVRCWGKAQSGQLGYALGYLSPDDVGDDESPASKGDVDVGGTVVQISAGTTHTCALLDTGNVRCWGLGQYGRLGYVSNNNIGDDETPASAGDVDIAGSAIAIKAGGDHTCALLDTGNVRCWGHGSLGALGYGDEDDIGDTETPASKGDVPVE